MESIGIHTRNEVTDRLFEIYSPLNVEAFAQLRLLIEPEAERLADVFYTHLLEVPESDHFLNHKVVEERLHHSMSEWIRRLFAMMDETQVEEHILWQQQVGNVHARINVPMRLVNHGIRVLKWEMDKIIQQAKIESSLQLASQNLVNDLLHFSSSLINESYLGFRMANERDEQAMRMQVTSFSIVIELERLRSSLFDWLRQEVSNLYEAFPQEAYTVSSIYTADFGLWVTYKAELLLKDWQDLVEKLHQQLDEIQSCVDQVNALDETSPKKDVSAAIGLLNEGVSEAAWLLADLSSQSYEMEVGRDPLTRLYNRRFLPSIMQNVINTTKNVSSAFTVLACDLDEFKSFNDQYGHDAGDKVLSEFAEFLMTNVRATDFVVRMGGDEFLIILPGTSREQGINVARQLIEKLASLRIDIDSDKVPPVQASIGVVEHDGHPDYMRILKQADHALYQAKTASAGPVFASSA